MAIPWLRVLNAVLGLTEFASKMSRGSTAAALGTATDAGTLQRADTRVETKLAGVVVAALKEAFDRDHQRLAFEREQRDADRKRAERLLRLDLARQAGDRELTRFRWLATLAIVSWLGTMLLVVVVGAWGVGAKVMLGIGWGCLLAALATALVAQSRLVQALGRGHDTGQVPALPSSDAAATAATWLLVAGLGVVAVATLVH